jgi:type II restriction enzyme
MDIPVGDASLGNPYASASQRARVISEAWVKAHGYCLACESDRLRPTSPNTQARDFECDRCGHAYELKSSLLPFGKKITDGAYSSMMRRIEASTVPSFLLLHYTATWNLANLFAVHHAFITAEVVEERKPLAETARRAGWIGCNILLSGIPPEGRIPLILRGTEVPKQESRSRFTTVEKLTDLDPSQRGWAISVLRLLHRMGEQRFTIADAYTFESELSHMYPANKNVRPKIRQQLQILRDAGLLTFEARGTYRLTQTFGDARLLLQ